MVYYLNQKQYVQKRIDAMGWLLKKQPKKLKPKNDTSMDNLTKLLENTLNQQESNIDTLFIKLKIQ